MSDIPKRAFSRTAKLASLPLSFAGRATLGVGKRLTGLADEIIGEKTQQRTAEQLFSVLGQLKGGAMKIGQALSIFEAALPETVAGPYREALTKLQNSAPPMPVAAVHRVMEAELGPEWRTYFEEFSEEPAAAASIGQVHRATWHDGREVAVKIQYPGAGDALRSDLKQLSRFAPLFKIMQPGFDIRGLIGELSERLMEELDYGLEAEAQSQFAHVYDGNAEILVPQVITHTERMIVTEWVSGTPLATIISEGTPQQRDRAGYLLTTLHFSAPALAGMLHSDPHPGNFQISDDDRLIVYDFGAVARLPEGMPRPVGELTRLTLEGDADAVIAGLRREGFIPEDLEIDGQAILDYLLPMLEPLQDREFQFSRQWLRQESMRLTHASSEAAQLGRKLSLPPSYLLIHRVTMGSIGVLCQLGAQANWHSIMEEWLPGFSVQEEPDS
ncbi:ABC1 kinase family protein [Natronoglycomyces albus]|uniref:AarF/ABC1/UbiB kinase family protein n=1 Tax=Natronoglycomyces albus TaxID=2811108 RepID=A0A895XJX8_9ACTN|nr:AarF/ABC1/UbiB kinase family protein [Natronoglycomyces albus]QSB06061.1 AarF/ABC1/UbiB kinase family protein [Natronoglycomyces albus]